LSSWSLARAVQTHATTVKHVLGTIAAQIQTIIVSMRLSRTVPVETLNVILILGRTSVPALLTADSAREMSTRVWSMHVLKTNASLP